MSRSCWRLLPGDMQDSLVSKKKWLEAISVAGVASDSRLVEPGFIFFALPCVYDDESSVDGRYFIDDALQSGAPIIVVQAQQGEPVGFDERTGYLIVKDIMYAIGQISAEFYDHPSQAMQLVGITGTNGKTTTSYFIASLAQALGVRSAVLGTNGYGPIDELMVQNCTTPGVIQLQQQLAQLRDMGVELVAMEVSSHGLVQRRVAGCIFDVGVLTNISQDHLDYHKTMASYIAAKQLLFTQMALQHVIINGDDEYAAQFLAAAGQARKWSYSAQNTALQAQDVTSASFGLLEAIGQAQMTLSMNQQQYTMKPHIIGLFNHYNLAAALLVLHALGHCLHSIVQAVPSLRVPDGRMQCVSAQLPQVIVDFAHTPDAIQVVLQALQQLAQARNGRLHVLFGCGGDRDQGKRALMAAQVQRLADVAMITSDNPRSESQSSIYTDIMKGFTQDQHCQVSRLDDRALAIKTMIRNAEKCDIIAILGKGHEQYQEILDSCLPFSDIEVARNALLEHNDFY